MYREAPPSHQLGTRVSAYFARLSAHCSVTEYGDASLDAAIAAALSCPQKSFSTSIDDSLRLLYGDDMGEGFPRMIWLHPQIDYSSGTVRLVNGIGLPVGGKDYETRGETMPLALCGAILKAHASRVEYEESQ